MFVFTASLYGRCGSFRVRCTLSFLALLILPFASATGCYFLHLKHFDSKFQARRLSPTIRDLLLSLFCLRRFKVVRVGNCSIMTDSIRCLHSTLISKALISFKSQAVSVCSLMTLSCTDILDCSAYYVVLLLGSVASLVDWHFIEVMAIVVVDTSCVYYLEAISSVAARPQCCPSRVGMIDGRL